MEATWSLKQLPKTVAKLTEICGIYRWIKVAFRLIVCLQVLRSSFNPTASLSSMSPFDSLCFFLLCLSPTPSVSSVCVFPQLPSTLQLWPILVKGGRRVCHEVESRVLLKKRLSCLKTGKWKNTKVPGTDWYSANVNLIASTPVLLVDSTSRFH